jgi:hypothetical protein
MRIHYDAYALSISPIAYSTEHASPVRPPHAGKSRPNPALDAEAIKLKMLREIVFVQRLLLLIMERSALSALIIYLFGMVINVLPAQQQPISTMIPKHAQFVLKALLM